MSDLKRWLEIRYRFIQNFTTEHYLWSESQMPVPKGLLLVGMPGCGKSIAAKNIAFRLQLPLYFYQSPCCSTYAYRVGSPLSETLKRIELLSPCVLWVDDIVQLWNAQDWGEFINWSRQCQELVFVVASTQNGSKLPREVFHYGLFDEIFFFDLPNYEERKEIISLHYRHYVGEDISRTLVERLAKKTDGFSGADLESAMRDAGYYLVIHGQRMTDDAIELMVSNIIPISQTNPKSIESIRQWGIEHAVPASGHPSGSTSSGPDCPV